MAGKWTMEIDEKLLAKHLQLIFQPRLITRGYIPIKSHETSIQPPNSYGFSWFFHMFQPSLPCAALRPPLLLGPVECDVIDPDRSTWRLSPCHGSDPDIRWRMFHQHYSYPPVENHRRTIGKWWFNGMLWG